MIQEIIVAIIALLVIIYLGYKVYQFFFTKEGIKGACGCSDCHCNTSKKT